MFVNLLSQNRSLTPNHEHTTPFGGGGWRCTKILDGYIFSLKFQTTSVRIMGCPLLSMEQKNYKTLEVLLGVILIFFARNHQTSFFQNSSTEYKSLILAKFMLLSLLLHFFCS
jgi:hypothetical protein